MSTTIIYDEAAIRFDAGPLGTRVVICMLTGSSNCYTTKYGRDGKAREVRSRSWQAVTAGTESQIVQFFAPWIGDLAGGMLRFSKGPITLHGFIAKMRRLAATAHAQNRVYLSKLLIALSDAPDVGESGEAARLAAASACPVEALSAWANEATSLRKEQTVKINLDEESDRILAAWLLDRYLSTQQAHVRITMEGVSGWGEYD